MNLAGSEVEISETRRLLMTTLIFILISPSAYRTIAPNMNHRHQDLPVILHNDKRGLLTVEKAAWTSYNYRKKAVVSPTPNDFTVNN